MTEQERKEMIKIKVIDRLIKETEDGTVPVCKDYNAKAALLFAHNVILGSERHYKCKANTIYETLRDMVIQGLDPAANQCYLISSKKGDMKLKRSYFGEQMIIYKICPEVSLITSEVVHEGETFTVEDIVNGLPLKTVHKGRNFATMGNAIIGAYCVIVNKDNKIIGFSQIPWKELQLCWEKATDTNKAFPAEMAKKTATMRACKKFANTRLDVDPELKKAYFNSIPEDERDTEKNEYSLSSGFTETGKEEIEPRDNIRVKNIKSLEELFKERRGEVK